MRIRRRRRLRRRSLTVSSNAGEDLSETLVDNKPVEPLSSRSTNDPIKIISNTSANLSTTMSKDHPSSTTFAK